MEYIVKFIETTQATYDSLSSKDRGGLYFTTDTNRLYKGDTIYTPLLTPKYANEWIISGIPSGWEVSHAPTWDGTQNVWTMSIQNTNSHQNSDIFNNSSNQNAISLTFTSSTPDATITANRYSTEHRVISYQLGKQGSELLATAEQGLNAELALNSLSYTLGSPIIASTTLSDRTSNLVSPTSGSDQITLTFPEAKSNKARDFLILIKKNAGFTGSLSIVEPTQNTVIYGDGFSVLSSLSDGDVYLISVTEIATDTFYTRAQKMEEP